MKKELISIAISIVVFATLFGLIAPVLHAQPSSFTIYGQVNDTDGTTPVDGVTVIVANLETGSSVAPTVTANGGWYIVNLASLQPDYTHSVGNRIQIFAYGACKTNTTVVPRAAVSPQRVDLILQVDTAPPTITNPQPPDGSFINDNTPAICANYSDPNGINVSLVKIFVDDKDETANATATVGEDYVCYMPIAALSEGLHNVTVNASDNCTNPNSTSWSFTVDTVPPTIEFIDPTPANDSTNTTGYVKFTANVSDPVPGSGLEDIINVSVWNETGIYRDNETMQAFDEHKYYYHVFLPSGNYTYKAYAKDIAGNTGVSETRVLRVNVTEYTVGVTLVSGYTIISLPINDTSVTNASTLAAKIGANCLEIVKWDSAAQAYVSYIPGVPLNDFDIVCGEGYFVNSNNPTTVEFTGIGWASPFTISLVTGYNIIGIPVNDASVTNASTLSAKIGANCTEIIKWDSATQAYVSYVSGVPLNDFVT
ncbi:MAG TPA: hypothetical protein C5S37_06905, partial [Methanophagales archaeon]|nr:hypothetical protein [Methanophagales archaeon]